MKFVPHVDFQNAFMSAHGPIYLPCTTLILNFNGLAPHQNNHALLSIFASPSSSLT